MVCISRTGLSYYAMNMILLAYGRFMDRYCLIIIDDPLTVLVYAGARLFLRYLNPDKMPFLVRGASQGVCGQAHGGCGRPHRVHWHPHEGY